MRIRCFDVHAGKSILTFVTSICLLSQDVMAEIKENFVSVSPQFDKCMNTGLAARGNAQGIVDCAKAEFNRQSDMLDSLYAIKINGDLSRSRKIPSFYRKDRRNAYLDKLCDRQARSAGELPGYSMWTIIYHGCLVSEAGEMIKKLERL